jgi:hypothetical protein
LLRGSVSKFFDRIRGVSLKAFGVKMSLTIGEAQDVLEDLLKATKDAIVSEPDPKLRPLFNAVRYAPARATVEEITKQVFGKDKSFVRGSEEHADLKTLRDLQLIRPQEGGTWEAGKHPVLTKFAQLILEMKFDPFATETKR